MRAARAALAGILLASPGLAACQAAIARVFLPPANRPAEFRVDVEREIRIPTSAGGELAADLFRPRTAEATPTILVRLPLARTFYNQTAASLVAQYWAGRGYTVVIQGTRGRYGSDGPYDPLRPERSDGIDTLRWLARQPWFDGRLGMWGGSAFGHTQWVLADQVDPGPSALMIQIASTSFHDMFYPGGAFSLGSALHWAVQSQDEADATPADAVLERGFDGFPLIEADDRALSDVGFFDDWVSHPERDAYWTAIDGDDRAARLVAPVLLMGGWYDPFLPSQLADFARIRTAAAAHVARETRLVIGPWAHAFTASLPGVSELRNYRQESLAPSLPWFDRHLLGRRDAESELAPVRLFVMGANVWRDEQEWPLARTVYTSFYLHSGGRASSSAGDGRLELAAPSGEQPADAFVYDPRDPVPSLGGAMLGPRGGVRLQNPVEARADVLVYSSAALERALEVTGPLELVLHVETDAVHTDFTAKLVDVHPDGSAYNVSEGVLRQRYEPGSPREISIELWPTSMLFRAGHRIRLEVSSSSYPRFDRNPNTGRDIASEREPVAAHQRVRHGPDAPSRLILPVIPAPETSSAGGATTRMPR